MRNRTGRFELANGGTIFLDEVGEIPLDLQSKLLRVLQDGDLERVGEEKTRAVDVKVIAAANRDLKVESRENRFREDLYFRLNVFPIHSLSLRERGGDIGIWALHFLEQVGNKVGKQYKLKQSDLQRIQSYSWPGNIRELKNVIECAAITAVSDRIKIDIPLEGQESAPVITKADDPPVIYTDEAMQKMLKDNMLAALNQTGWRLFGEEGAAELLGMKPTTLASRIKRMGLKKG